MNDFNLIKQFRNGLALEESYEINDNDDEFALQVFTQLFFVFIIAVFAWNFIRNI